MVELQYLLRDFHIVPRNRHRLGSSSLALKRRYALPSNIDSNFDVLYYGHRTVLDLVASDNPFEVLHGWATQSS